MTGISTTLYSTISVHEIYEGDTFNVRALPLAYSNFDNVSNGQTIVVAALGSIIEKTA